MMGKWMAVLASAGLAACVSFGGEGLRPGASGDEIRTAMGAPGTVWPEADGGSTWEYPRAPEGRQTFMVRLGADGRLREIRPALQAENFARVRAGVTKRDEVRRLLGAPYLESYFARKNETVWDYRYMDPLSGFGNTFHVSFDERGVVAGTANTVDDGRFIQSGPSLK